MPAPWDTGYLLYAPDGTMVAILDHTARGQRPAGAREGTASNVSSAPARVTTLSTQEQVQVLEGFTAYAGNYTLAGDVVTHHVRYALNPEAKGRELRRSVRLENGQLLISTRNLGNRYTVDLVWERVGASPHG